jgi:hypothetical protein
MSSLIDKGRILAAAVAVVVVAGCTVTASPASPSPTSAGASAAPTVALTPPPSAAVTPSAAALPSSTPVTPPTPPNNAAWSKPRPVGTAANCRSVTAGIDTGSRYHVAAECGGNIVYSASNRDGSWSSKVFAHPANRLDLDPQIAFNGQVVYVAFTRINPDGACGSLGVDVGVYYRQTRPDGSWTDEKRIGEAADGLDSFRVASGIIHAIVLGAGADPVMYYEIVDRASTHRYPISDGLGKMSLRIGTDGRARIAYYSPPGLRYAIFTGSGLSTFPITGTRGDDQLPALVLDNSNHAHLLWSRMPNLGGCALPERTPEDGTYYATNATGKWVSSRITTNLGVTSLQVDEVTGRIHVLVAGSGVRYYTKLPGGSWRGTKLSSASVPLQLSTSAAIRLDPATGRLLIVYLAQQSNALGKVYAITKP